MVAVGILYLVFEDKLLADFSGSPKPRTEPKANGLSRALIGVQVSRFLLMLYHLGSPNNDLDWSYHSRHDRHSI